MNFLQKLCLRVLNFVSKDHQWCLRCGAAMYSGVVFPKEKAVKCWKCPRGTQTYKQCGEIKHV